MSSPPASPHTPYPTHGPPPVVRVVAGAVIRGGRLLAAQRPPEKSEPGRWELPGGKVEPGESDAEALRRELQEELLIDVVVGELLGESLAHQPRRRIQLLAYAAALPHGEPVRVEHTELRWVGADGLDELEWAAADLPLLDCIRPLLAAPIEPPLV